MDKYLHLRARALNGTSGTTSGSSGFTTMTFTELQFSNQMSKYSELENTWLALFIIILTILVVCVLLLIVLMKRLNIAVALIGQASK